MDEGLIGQEALIELPCEAAVYSLLFDFIEELLLVSGSDVEGPERLEADLLSAIEELCGASEGKSARLEARIEVVSEGLDVTLRRPDAGGSQQSIRVREA